MRRSPFALTLLALTILLGLGLPGSPIGAATPTADTAATPANCLATTEANNLAIARVWHEEVINRRNPAALDGILAPELVHHAAGGYPDSMTAAGVGTMMDGFLGAFSDLEYTFDFFVVEADLVVERYTATGTQDGPLGNLPATGRSATWTGINIFRIECGRIVEVWSEVDALSRNAQLAAVPASTPAP